MKPALVMMLLLGLRLGAQMPAGPEPGEPAPDAGPDFGGPNLPSRRGAATVTRDGELLRLRPYVSLEGIYDTGLTAVTVDSTGKPADDSGFGVEGTVGVTGIHTWKRTALGVDYRLNGRHYGNHSFYDGIDNALTLSLDHQASRRWRIMLGESLTSYSRNYYSPYSLGWLGVSDYAPASMSDLAGNELFDGRTTALSGTGRAVYQSTPRLSFGFGGTGAIVRRRSSALPGMNAYAAVGDMGYRVTRFQTIGFDYTFTHFDFQNAFGTTDAHGAGFNYAIRVGRNWELKLRAGGQRVETLRLTQVSIDPVIASIIGRNYGIETYHKIQYVPTADFTVVRGAKRSTAGFSVSRDLNAGNGLLLTSVTERATAFASWTVSRRFTAGLSAQASRYRSVGQNLGNYADYGGGGGVSYLIGKNFSVFVRSDLRHYELSRTSFQRDGIRTSAGIAWSPGEVPLNLW